MLAHIPRSRASWIETALRCAASSSTCPRAHLLTDLKGNSENHHLFEWKTGYLINFEKVAFTINYLRTIAPLAKIVWLGPFVEARVNFRDPPSIARDAFRMNPVSLQLFKALDAEIAKEVADGPQTLNTCRSPTCSRSISIFC